MSLSLPRLALALTLIISPARAGEAFGDSSGTTPRLEDPLQDEGPGNGVYGRFNGDLSLRIGVGTEVSLTSQNIRPLLVGNFIAYQTVGIYAAYREGLPSDSDFERALSLGLTFSPLFIWRWSEDLQWGSPYWDLLVDSIGISAAIHLAQPENGNFGQLLGAEWGLTAGFPLLGRANGLWLRTQGNIVTGKEALSGTAWLYLAWEGFFYGGLLGEH